VIVPAEPTAALSVTNDGRRAAKLLEQRLLIGVGIRQRKAQEDVMGFGRGLLLWLLGIPLPIIILLAIFMHH
jgi:hypothetical protein